MFASSCVYILYIHISRRICDGEPSSATASSGVIRDALRESRLLIFGLCSIRLRRHGPFISCNVLLPRCFALSGTHLGSIFFLIWVDATPARFFFMCFFVNNQHRILLEKCTTGSADLENIFECNLKRIGRVVAVLDTWNQPLYLGRVWTMYEQFVASTLHIPMCFVMPEDSTVSRWKVFNILCFPRFPTY